MKRGTLTVWGALLALAGAAVLSFVFYFVVGFPANVPTAVGAAVLLAELIDAAGRGEGRSPLRIGLTAFHAVVAGLASWLGVEIVRLLGWLN